LKPTLAGHLLIVALLGVLVLLLYSRSLENNFVWDDHEQILKNPAVLGQSSFTQLFSTGVWAFQHPGEHAQDNQFRPLQMLTYRLVGQASGFSAASFHWVSLFFHFLASLLVYAVANRLTRRIYVAAAVACLFAAHPIHSEAVDWISSLADLGCAVFFLLSFFLYLKADRRWLWAASFLSFGLALLWKEMAVTLPLLITSHILLCSRGKRSLKLTIPYWGVFAAYLLLRFHALGSLYAPQRDWILSPLQYVLTDIHLLAAYWWKLVWPLPLMGYHVFAPVTSLAEPRVWIALLFVLALAALGVYRFRRDPLTTFAVTWVFLALLPVLNLYAVGRNVFAERYLYIPSAGFCLLAVLLVAKYRNWLAGAALALVLLFYGKETAVQSPVWKDDMSFFSRSLEQSPNSAFLHNMVANLLRAENGDSKTTGEHYTQAIALARQWNPPENLQISIAYVGLANIAAESGDFNTALHSLDLAQTADPLNSEARTVRGSVLTQAGHWDEARKVLHEALEKNPNDEIALSSLGIVAWQGEHSYPSALNYFEQALRLPSSDITSASIHNNVGSVYCEMQRCGDGLSHFRQAIQLDPVDPEYYTNLGTALRLTGHPAEAREQFAGALKINPGYEPAKASLARLDQEERR
jgi:Tfp pilus assembly protein PilF